MTRVPGRDYMASLSLRFRALPWLGQFILFGVCAAITVVLGGVFAMIPLTLAFVWLGGDVRSGVGLSLSGTRLTQFGVGVALGAAMVFTWCLVFRAGFGIRWERNVQVTGFFWLAGVWFYLKSAVFEELVFRGYGFVRLSESLGFRAAQALTAILFAVYHVLNVGMPLVPALLFTGMGSLLFGYAFMRSGGVMLPIGMHAAWNFWQEQLMASSGRGQAGMWKPVMAPGAHIPFVERYAALVLVTLGAALVIRRAYSWRRN